MPYPASASRSRKASRNASSAETRVTGIGPVGSPRTGSERGGAHPQRTALGHGAGVAVAVPVDSNPARASSLCQSSAERNGDEWRARAACCHQLALWPKTTSQSAFGSASTATRNPPGTRRYRQDDVEDCPTQTVIPVAGRPAAGRDPDKGSGQGGETSSLFGIGARRHVGERDPGSRQAVEDASGRSTTTRAKLENPHRLRLRPCRRQLGQRIAQQFDSGSDSRRTLKELFGHRRKRGIRLPDIVRKAFG